MTRPPAREWAVVCESMSRTRQSAQSSRLNDRALLVELRAAAATHVGRVDVGVHERLQHLFILHQHKQQ
jgi:hypothetical protein